MTMRILRRVPIGAGLAMAPVGLTNSLSPIPVHNPVHNLRPVTETSP